MTGSRKGKWRDMSEIAYRPKRFRKQTMGTIVMASKIVKEYEQQGFVLTLRQLYYQFVARGLIPNNQKEYNNLGAAINNARLAGLIDWEAITDRTRNVQSNQHWDSPTQIIRAAANSYKRDKWRNQPNRVEVWIEKDALLGVIEGICRDLDVKFFSCRGYVSQSEMWVASQRAVEADINGGQETHIIHLGDHDPSGIDMTRDIRDRMEMFCKYHSVYSLEVERVALSHDQVLEHKCPPNPAKITDSRAAGYIGKYGYESWELDALEPSVLIDLVSNAVLQYRDEELWQEALDVEAREMDLLEDLTIEMESRLQ